MGKPSDFFQLLERFGAVGVVEEDLSKKEVKGSPVERNPPFHQREGQLHALGEIGSKKIKV